MRVGGSFRMGSEAFCLEERPGSVRRADTYMPRGLRAGFRLDAMIRRASRRWLSSASSAI
jgi:hypothetical protein